MKYIIFVSIAFLLVFVSCKSEKNEQAVTPQKFNEQIVLLEESLEEPLLKAEAEIKVRSEKADFTGMAQSAKAMEDTVSKKISEIKKIAAVGKGGEDFKTVAVRYFEYIKSIYTSYRNIAEAKTEEARVEATKKMNDVLNSQPAVLSNLQTSQQKYATDNNFVVGAE